MKTKWSYIYLMRTSFERVVRRLMLGEEKYADFGFVDDGRGTELFKEKALRHLIQAFSGETDEDHLSAAVVNILIIMEKEPLDK